MGTDPTQDSYVPGDVCVVCNVAGFGSVTPRYIEVHIEGLTVCPGLPTAPGDGVYLLTQLGPCVWFASDGFWDFVYSLGVGQSSFTILQPPFFAFSSLSVIECVVEFNNANGPCGMAVRGTGGTATMFWGPTIGP